MGNQAPQVSVVIPCYNHGHFLREALESVGTPAVSTEIVVVDDGSTDNTPEIVATFETSNAFRCVRQHNSGLAEARNRGLKESRGPYILLLDADDRLAPGAVDLGAAMLDAHPECAFVFGRSTMMDRDGVLHETPAQPRIVRDHYRELLRQNYIWMPGMAMFRRDALERVGGFNSAVDAAADYEMYLHIARHRPIYDHGQVVAHYRKHDGNMSGNSGRMLRETLAVLATQRPFLQGDEASLAAYREGWRVWQEFYGNHLVTEIGTAARNGRWLEALGKVAVLGYYHPRGLWQHAKRKSMRSLARSERASQDAGDAGATPTADHRAFARTTPPRTEISPASSRASSPHAND